jgi:hypothetical protein
MLFNSICEGLFHPSLLLYTLHQILGVSFIWIILLLLGYRLVLTVLYVIMRLAADFCVVFREPFPERRE